MSRQSTVAIIYRSGFGHTARQAEAVARGAASVEITQVPAEGQLCSELHPTPSSPHRLPADVRIRPRMVMLSDDCTR
jgi:hypothetical protein